MKAVLDTNVFISGIFWAGESNRTIIAWKEERFILVTSPEAVSELVKILSDFKIRMSNDLIKGWVDLITRNSVFVEPKERLNAVKDDPKDDIFIETAIAGNADFIVSQDKDLLKLKEFRRIRIITPEEFNKLF